MAITVRPPPPIPAITRPRIIVHWAWARPQIMLPAAKITLENINPDFRENMSVRRPARGWQAALEIKYAVASQDSRERELNEDDIGPVKVATTVMSIQLD